MEKTNEDDDHQVPGGCNKKGKNKDHSLSGKKRGRGGLAFGAKKMIEKYSSDRNNSRYGEKSKLTVTSEQRLKSKNRRSF